MKMNKKKLMTFGIVGLFAMIFVTAGLLTFYGQIEQDVTVEQAITLSEYNPAVLSVAGSETEYSNTIDIVSHTVNDLDVMFTNVCTAIDLNNDVINCVGVATTNMVGLGVVGYDTGAGGYDAEITPWEGAHYKALDYMDDVSLSTLDIDYTFTITERTGVFGDTLFPYIVIVGTGFEAPGVAVQMAPDGNTYVVGTEYAKTLEGATFHVPGSEVCTQNTPCDIAALQLEFPFAEVERVRLAFGAWSGVGSINILMGIDTISGEETGNMKFKMYSKDIVPTIQKYQFAENIEAGTYTITTEVLPFTA